jgi:hypothetical protein
MVVLLDLSPFAWVYEQISLTKGKPGKYAENKSR